MNPTKLRALIDAQPWPEATLNVLNAALRRAEEELMKPTKKQKLSDDDARYRRYVENGICPNARLVAAAPEMLEALEQLLDELPERGAVTQATRNEALAAIRKAKGEI